MARDFAAMGSELFAAEAAAEAIAAHSAQGDEEAMLASTTTARRHLEACEGLDESVLPSLAALQSEPVGPPPRSQSRSRAETRPSGSATATVGFGWRRRPFAGRLARPPSSTPKSACTATSWAKMRRPRDDRHWTER